MIEQPVKILRGTSDEILEQEVRQAIAITTWDQLINALDATQNWGRRSSVWPMGFGLACCAIEMICTAASRYDISRFGAELFRGSPRQADLMIVSGTVTKKMVPMIVRLYNQMPEPKFVMAMGACATAGGPFKEGYNVVSGIDKFLPVDVYVPGCPPTPQALLHGLMTLQKKIDGQSMRTARWYDKTTSAEIPVPILGPDLIDQRRIPEISKGLKEHAPAAGPAKLPKIIESSKILDPSPPPSPTRGEGERNSKVKALAQQLNQAFGEGTAQVSRENLVVPPQKWRAVAEHLKTKEGYDYLSNLTSSDYTDCYEVVYHLGSIQRGMESKEPLLGVKVRADKTNPVVPSAVPVWVGADFQEREVYDMMGIKFDGHPNLTRILMWEGFEGFPLRKDYLEAYYEEPGKIFSSRWKEGKHQRAEERVEWADNVKYPKNWDPQTWKPPQEEFISTPINRHVETLRSDMLAVNIGPQHPSTHGVFRMKLLLNGERVAALEPVMGYMHRNHEKIGERNMYIMNFPYTDRLDYICSMYNNFAYAIAVEKLAGIKVPERAEYIRVIMGELTRIVNHFWAIGFLLNDLGCFFTPALYAIEERELILDLFEMTAGSRMMCNYFRFGGVAYDLPEEFLPLAKPLIWDRLPKAIDQMDELLSRNEIMLARCQGVGVLTKEEAIANSAAGPVLRGSGVKYDVRKAEPYSVYDRFQFDVPTRSEGDIYARYWVRLQEMRESVKILKQAMEQLPGGEFVTGGKKAWSTRVPEGEVYGRVENPKGELGFYIVSDGGPQPYRYHIRAPSFINLNALGKMCQGHLVADTVGILGSIDIVLGETDR